MFMNHARFADATEVTRGDARRPLRLTSVAITGRQEPLAIAVLNLSHGGMLIEVQHASLTPGERLTARLADGAEVQGAVVWASDAFYGVSFDRPLSPGQVAAALLVAPPANTEPGLPASVPGWPDRLLPTEQREAGRPEHAARRRAGGLTRLEPTVNFAVPVYSAVAFWVFIGGILWAAF